MNLRKTMVVGVVMMALAAASHDANAGERHVTGAAIGAGIGAIIAGPPGAIVGGAVGAVVKGPRVTRHRHCWRGKSGRHYCEWR
jgi:hypothetical protein